MKMPQISRTILAVLAIISLSLAAWMAFVTVNPAALEVRVVSPTDQDISAALTTNGKVTPIDDFQARAAVAGLVDQIYVKVGQQVVPGQRLLTVKDPFAKSRYASAIAGLESTVSGDQNIQQGGSQEDQINFKADLKRAELEEADATNRLGLLRGLQKNGDASIAEVADAERRLAAAETALEAVRERITKRYSTGDITSSAARVADAKANLDTAKAVLANTNLISSVAGTVYAVSVLKGDFVGMGADLLHIADLNLIEIHAFFDEPEIGQLRQGEPVEIFWEAKPGRSWHGHVRQPPLSVKAQESRAVGECLITVDDAQGELLPNTNVTVKVTTGQHAHVLTIPRESLQTHGATHFVYRIVDGRILRTDVTTGIINLSQVEIASGLSKADLIVRDGSNGNFPNGRLVKVLN